MVRLRLSANFLSRWETKSIWVDASYGNGYVLDWSRNNGLNIQNHINHVKLDAIEPVYWSHIEGQGDLFKQSSDNRVYVQVRNLGEGASIEMNNGISLYVKNYSVIKGHQWVDWIYLEDLRDWVVYSHAKKAWGD